KCDEVAVGRLQDLEQPMFDLDVEVAARQRQTSRRLQRPPAQIVQSSDQGFEIDRDHSPTFLLFSCLRATPPRTRPTIAAGTHSADTPRHPNGAQPATRVRARYGRAGSRPPAFVQF